MKFDALLEDFQNHAFLRKRIEHVLLALPDEVRDDLLLDARFRITLENTAAGPGSSFWMPSPGAHGDQSRCVVLRGRLEQASEPFACWVIAHELAHAHLRNGGWQEVTDPELAADALAALWGFPRPAYFG